MDSKKVILKRQVYPLCWTPEKVKNSQESLLILDVQNPKFVTSIIPGAKRFNVDIFLKDIPRDQSVVVTCLLGKRSLSVARQLIGRGYSNVYVLKGGVMAWQRAGYVTWLTELPA